MFWVSSYLDHFSNFENFFNSYHVSFTGSLLLAQIDPKIQKLGYQQNVGGNKGRVSKLTALFFSANSSNTGSLKLVPYHTVPHIHNVNVTK